MNKTDSNFILALESLEESIYLKKEELNSLERQYANLKSQVLFRELKRLLRFSLKDGLFYKRNGLKIKTLLCPYKHIIYRTEYSPKLKIEDILGKVHIIFYSELCDKSGKEINLKI